MARLAGSASLVLVDGATPLRPEPALFDAMIEGWCRQHSARRLSPTITRQRVRVVQRFRAFTGAWPWEWTAAQADAWVSQGAWAHSTVRNYQGSLALVPCLYLRPSLRLARSMPEAGGRRTVQQDPRRAGTAPPHVADYEGRPGRRPFTRAELQALFDTADAAVEEAAGSPRKGWLAAFRDATLIKVTYGWGLRCREAAMLDVADFGPNPAAAELGRYGICHVRFGKAMRGSPPRRRAVASVMPWAVEALAQYVGEVRPLHGQAARGPALWLTERGGRISSRRIDERFAQWRRRAGLPAELSVHCLRHSYISHLVEDGADPTFVQHQAGHSWASTTAIYTTVGADHTNRALRAVLDRAFGEQGEP